MHDFIYVKSPDLRVLPNRVNFLDSNGYPHSEKEREWPSSNSLYSGLFAVSFLSFHIVYHDCACIAQFHEVLFETHLLMIEVIPGRFNKLFVCEEEIPDADILALRLYPALILYHEHGLNAPSELIFRNDMIQINIRCV